MAIIYPEPSRTFSEYLLLPNLTCKNHSPEQISLVTPLVRYKPGARAGEDIQETRAAQTASHTQDTQAARDSRAAQAAQDTQAASEAGHARQAEGARPAQPRAELEQAAAAQGVNESPINLNIPLVSAIMQAVSGENMAIELARCGGMSFIYGSQPIAQQAEMVRQVKHFKAGFVVSDSNVTRGQSLGDVLAITKKTGHSTVAVTEDGSPHGKLEGIITGRDYRPGRTPLTARVEDFMTPLGDGLVYGTEGISLPEANDLIWEHKLNSLPVVDKNHYLLYLVFRKDYTAHKAHPLELSDDDKRLLVGAGVNTHDYQQRVPVLVEAGADVLCIDSSDGFTEWQKDVIEFVKHNYHGKVKIGAGNIVDKEGFFYLAEAGADFIKVGIGGGSICITREQKGLGRGQATALIEVAQARSEYLQKTGEYIPICSDGGIVHDYHIALALAMGADFVMLGRYFARFDESPGRKIRLGMNYVKEYWGEGSNRAKNWQRYDQGYHQGSVTGHEQNQAQGYAQGYLNDHKQHHVDKQEQKKHAFEEGVARQH